MSMVQGSRTRNNISMTLLRQLLSAGAQLLIVVIIARQLGPMGNGYYGMAVLLPSLMTNLLNIGIGPASVYYVSRNEFAIKQAAIENIKLGAVISAFGLALSVPLVLAFGQNVLPGIPAYLILCGLIAFPVSLILSYMNAILQGIEDFKSYNVSVLTPPYVTLFFIVITLLILDFDNSVTAAVFSYLVGQIAGLIVVGVYIYRSIGVSHTSSYINSGSTYRKQVIGFGWKAHLSNVLAFVNYRMDVYLVNFFLGPMATGLYFVSVQIAERLWILSQAASIVLLPRLSAMQRKPIERLALTQKGWFVVVTATAAACFVVSLALYYLIEPVFGYEYLDSLPAFFWLLPGIVVGAGARVQSNCIAASGKPEWNMYVALAMLIVNALGNLCLIPSFGMSGAAMATTIAYLCNAIIKFFLVKRTAWID